MLDGGSKSDEWCVGVDDSDTIKNGKIIAAQCCDADGMGLNGMGCYRWFGSSDDEGCIGGHSKTRKKELKEMTYREVFAKCDSMGLVMCQANCKDKGCFYNRHPVWTGIECDPS